MCTVPVPILNRPTILKMHLTNHFSFTLSINEMKKQFQYRKRFLLFINIHDMKKHFIQKKITFLAFILIILTASATYAQQQFTQTVTAQNRDCNVQCTIIDAPGFTYDPGALIFATPVLVNGVNPYPYPIGALYRTYQRKWSIFNLNGAVMAIGAQYNLEYYPNTDANHFVFIVPQHVHSNEDVYIDHAGLNNNPDAKIRIFPTNPQVGNAVFNVLEVRVTYVPSASKWVLINKDGGDVPAGVAYNIMFTSGGPSVTNDKADKTLNTNPKTPVSIMPECNCVIPTSLPPNGSAGGDLSGSFPYPKVTGLAGKPLSNDPPSPGQVLKWNGSAWEPANENGTGGITYNAGTGLAIQGSTIYANNIAAMWNANKLSGNAVTNTTPKIGDVLKWNGTAWEPAAESVGSNSQSSAKPSVIDFNQSAEVSMFDPNINTVFITGLDHQTFTVSKSSHITFSTTISFIKYQSRDPITGSGPVMGAVQGILDVDILDASNNVVGHATAMGVAGDDSNAGVVAVGACWLPAAGTYHTKVSLFRYAGNHAILILSGSYYTFPHRFQAGQIIIQIFPD